MARALLSTKHVQIIKANTAITASVAIASFLAVASLLGARALWNQKSYQGRVIKEKELAAKTLKDNLKAVDSLVNSYNQFVDRDTNVIGGLSDGTNEKDGDNAKLTLDALPSQYDFPALTSSIEKLLLENNFKIESISGTDDELAQQAKENIQPEVVEIPFEFTIKGSYDPMYTLIDILERSIRPYQLQKLLFTASDNEIQLSVEGKTFYQSGKTLNITKKVVR